MAPPPAIELSHSEYTLVAALRESMEKLVEAKVAAAIQESINTVVEARVATALDAAKNENEHESKKAEPELDMAGMHCQILSNATYLYQLLTTGIMPKESFDVVTTGSGTTISAAVVYMLRNTRRILLRGGDAPTPAKAQQKLLNLITELLHKYWDDFLPPNDHFKQINGDDNSTYWTPHY